METALARIFVSWICSALPIISSSSIGLATFVSNVKFSGLNTCSTTGQDGRDGGTNDQLNGSRSFNTAVTGANQVKSAGADVRQYGLN